MVGEEEEEVEEEEEEDSLLVEEGVRVKGEAVAEEGEAPGTLLGRLTTRTRRLHGRRKSRTRVRERTTTVVMREPERCSAVGFLGRRHCSLLIGEQVEA